MPRDFELETQLATLELKCDVARAVEHAKAMRRTQARTPKAEIETDDLRIQKRRAKEIARARSHRCPRGALED
jgi:hypothetical protein